MNFYILNEKHEVLPATSEEWMKFFEDPSKRRVAFDTIGPYDVSTAFISIPGFESYMSKKPKNCFETIVSARGWKGTRKFGGLLCRRRDTWDEAVKSHNEAVEEVKRWISAEKKSS